MKRLSTSWVRRALLSIAGVAVIYGCSTDQYHFVPDGPPEPPPDGGEAGTGSMPPPPPKPSTPTACTEDADCASLSSTELCDTTAGYCVECDPAREGELERCGEGTYCAAGGHCTIGCQSDADCRGVSCDLTRGLCVNCTIDADCGTGTACIEAVCTPSCTGEAACPNGWLCCDGSCKNPETDITSCGACATQCDAGGACWNGVCGEGPCAPGTAECDGEASNGCETPTTDDAANCGKCRLTCASNYCAGGECSTMGCEPGTADCNGLEDDRCETDLSDVTSCKMCRNKCSDNHGEPSCGKDGCAISCDEGYDDCDADVGNGCEINLKNDDKHCGDCDTACGNEHGTTACKDGECVPRCASGYSDCDGDAANGCETDTDSSSRNCGACGEKCLPANGTGMCTDGVCKVSCATGFEDCDGSSKNGCEANLSAPETCGSCDNKCSDNGGKATCTDPATGSCAIKCDVMHADCMNGIADGCETDITISASNCGGCGNVCTSSVGTPACRDSQCGVSTCTDPNFECVPDDGKKCETNITNDPNNCGGCGNTCYYKNGKGTCTAKVCERTSCDAGYDDCNEKDNDGCETALGTKDNCRSCGETCIAQHGTNECTSSGCLPTCATGWGDCDGNKANGCETPLNTLSDCGACNAGCSKAHGTATCVSRSCEIDQCDNDWRSCDTEATAKNGCETSITTATNCGACGVACSKAHGTPACTSSHQCIWTACDTGYDDCTSTAGCETQLGTVDNCLSCGNKCVKLNATTNNCTSTGCSPVCSPSNRYASCDGDASNGCETDLFDPAHCGSCTTVCTTPNGTATCTSGTCGSVCDATHLDCTSAPGCETLKGTTTNCTKCGEACSNAHGTFACGSTGCTASCTDPAWGNCDNNLANGCETSLRSTTDCGTCGTPCDIPNSVESCVTGTCLASSCSGGFEDCDANGSCETNLNTSAASCGACNHACTALNGTNPCTGGACTPACTTGFKSCDSNPDNGCETALNANPNCGNCGVTCAFPNAGASCSGSPVGSCVQGSCNAGFGDCTSAAGCETNLNTSTTSCGTCNHACTAQNGTNPCVGGTCTPACTTGFKSCDGNADNGCEAALNANPNCGNCGITCAFPNAVASCVGSPIGSCQQGACSAGFADCTSAAGCETNLNTDAAHCGDCTKACTAQNGTNPCVGGVCTPSCSTGFKNCDNDPSNGCEASLSQNPNCGACGVNCANMFPNAASACSGSPTGSCVQGTCNAGFADCTASPGCETTLGQAASNCGSCGDICTNSHGTTSCGAKTGGGFVCKPACADGYGDCDGNPSNGCEVDLHTATACGVCGNVCTGATPDCVNASDGYKCQARVSYVNDVESSVTGTPPTLNLSHTLATGSNRLVLAAIVSQSTQSSRVTGAKPSTVTYGGVAMTFSGSQNNEKSSDNTYFDQPYLFYYYLTDSGTNHLPASGAQTLVVVDQAGKAVMLAANLLEFTGVNQTAPLLPNPLTDTGKSMNAPGSTCAATGTLATTLPGSGLYALTAAHYSGTATVSGLTQSIAIGPISSQVRVYGGYRDSAASSLAVGSYTIGYNWQWCNPAAVLPVIIVPYRP